MSSAAISCRRPRIQKQVGSGKSQSCIEDGTVSHSHGPDPILGTTGHAIRRQFIAVELNKLKTPRVANASEQVRVRINDHSDAIDSLFQLANPIERFLRLDKSLRAGVKIEAQGPHPSLDTHRGIGLVCDTANFNTNAP